MARLFWMDARTRAETFRPSAAEFPEGQESRRGTQRTARHREGEPVRGCQSGRYRPEDGEAQEDHELFPGGASCLAGNGLQECFVARAMV